MPVESLLRSVGQCTFPRLQSSGLDIHARTARRVAGWSLASVFVVLAVTLAVLRYRAPSLLRQRAMEAVHAACPACTLEIGRLELGVLSGRIRAFGVHYANAPTDVLHIDARIDAAGVESGWWSLVTGRPRMTRIVLDGFRLTLLASIRPNEGWAHPPPDPPGSAFLALPALRIDRVELRRGTFVYREAWPGRTVAIEFDSLEGYVTALATRRDLAAGRTVARLAGRVAGSGQGSLLVRTDLLAPFPNATIELGLRDQDLAAFQAYLVPTEGAHLSGRLVEATAVMTLGHGIVRGQLTGLYDELAVRFERTPERGGIETALNNLGVAIQVSSANVNEPRVSRSTPIARLRLPGEPIIGFLWSSLRDACLQLILRDGRRL